MNEATGLLGRPAYFVHWGVVQLSLANLIVISLMVILFVLAVTLKMPNGHSGDDVREDPDVQ